MGPRQYDWIVITDQDHSYYREKMQLTNFLENMRMYEATFKGTQIILYRHQFEII